MSTKRRVKSEPAVVEFEEAKRLLDPFYIHGADPEYRYRWVNANARDVAYRRSLGYEVVEKGGDTATPEGLVEGAAPDSTYENVVPGMILMRVHKDQYAKILAYKDMLDARHRQQIKDQFEEFREMLRARGTKAQRLAEKVGLRDDDSNF